MISVIFYIIPMVVLNYKVYFLKKLFNTLSVKALTFLGLFCYFGAVSLSYSIATREHMKFIDGYICSFV